jgi:putative ABC transport system permease protein
VNIFRRNTAGSGVAGRLYRVLLRSYPAAFRGRFGDEIAGAFEESRQQPRPTLRQAWFVAASLVDVVRNGLAQRRLERRAQPPKDSLMPMLLADLRAAVRAVVRNPRLTILATLTLGLGVTFATALFNVAHAALLRPLPFAQEDEVVTLWEYSPEETDTVLRKTVLTPANFLDLRERLQSFAFIAAIAPFSGTLAHSQESSQVLGRRVTAEVFGALGVVPALGRPFSRADEDAAARTVILSHGTWQRFFGGDPAIVGRTILLNEVNRTVVGVMPASFRLPGRQDDVLIPFVFSAWEKRARKSHWVRGVARIKPGVTIAAARADAARVGAELEREFPDANTGETVILEPIREQMVGELRPALFTLLAAVSVVLLIACVNVANLLLANGTARRQEIAIRVALGAGRLRLIRQLAAETLLLAVLGGAAGLAGAIGMLRLASLLLPPDLRASLDTSIDLRVMAAALGACTATATLVGLIPALGVWTRASTSPGARTTTDARTARVRHALVVIEVALAVVLLAGAGLVMRSFARLTSVELGFRSDHLLTFRTDLPRGRYAGPEQWKPLFDRLIPDLESISGVTSAAAVTALPLNMGGGSNAIFIEGRPAPKPNDNTYAIYRLVTPKYFETVGIRIVDGRDFDSRDGIGTQRVGAVNETLAARMWPGGRAVGKRLTFSPRPTPNDWITVVAVVGDTHHESLSEQVDIQLYAPYTQEPNWMPPVEFALRTNVPPMSVANTVRDRMRVVDPLLPVEDLQPMDAVVASSVATPRFNLALLGGLAGSALLLAAIGVYGLLAFSVALRSKELGVRLALGATRSDLGRMVIGDGLRLVSMGLLAGVLAASVATRWIQALLFEVEPSDPATFAGVAVLLVSIAVLACYVPARRAAATDPIAALRND